MATTEHTINDALAAILRTTRRAWSKGTIIRAENTGMLRDSNGRPDILVLEPSVSSVSIETEVLPAVTVEAEALSRLGCTLKSTGRTILSSVAVRFPRRIRDHQGNALTAELRDSLDLEFALYTGASTADAVRWPRAGWIRGSARDLSILAQSASVPPEVVEKAADQLVAGVTEAAWVLEEMEHTHPGAMQKICDSLRQYPGEQTRRMATTILLNAFVFQDTLANGVGDLSEIKSLQEINGQNQETLQSAFIKEWRKILAVNYWPIFDIACRVLVVVPQASSKELIIRLINAAGKLLENRLMKSHDLTGAVFQRLIADRKFLAAYYTTPPSAAMLVGLAINPQRLLSSAQWGDPLRVKGLRVADFSCGTGTLLSTAYQEIGQIHELEGGDSEAIHPGMIAYSIIGCDVLPAAAHLTASMLSGIHPTVNYKKGSIYTMAYGVLPNNKVAVGSLDLLDPEKPLEVTAITAKAAGAEGESEEDTWTKLPHQDFDLVIMNPPFTRSTGHEASKIGVPNPMFAAFAASKSDQRLMAKRTKELTKGTSAHGNAGEASYFLVLADKKLRVGGILALVMQLSLLSGESWKESRRLLANRYSDILLVSIAGARDDEMSFSADTGMGECLLVARKAKGGGAEVGREIRRASDRATFVILRQRPASKLQGSSVAQEILRLIDANKLRNLEDGPLGGTQITFGVDVVGEALSAPLPFSGSWNPTRIADLALAQAAYQIANEGIVWLPGISRAEAPSILIKSVGGLGEIGPYHSDIDGVTQTKSVRGPFEHIPLLINQVATYPILWGPHKADHERCMRFEADCQGIVRPDASHEKVDTIWESRSHCHFNQNFRFNSQSTAMQFTARPTLGGRAWISINLRDAKLEKALVLWANTSLGLLLHWYHANKQQAGRGNVVSTSLAALPVLNVRALAGLQLTAAAALFDEFANVPLRSVDQIDIDTARADLDRRFLTQVLSIPADFVAPDGPIDLLRKKLAKEPSIMGGKQAASMRKKTSSAPKKAANRASARPISQLQVPRKERAPTLF